jgi:hypothetical protein
LKSGKKGGIKRRSGRKDIAKAALQPGPEFFDRVEFRRIGRQKPQGCSFPATAFPRIAATGPKAFTAGSSLYASTAPSLRTGGIRIC